MSNLILPEQRQHRPELPEAPPRIARLPVDARGYPVPWFVGWVNGKPDHRLADQAKLVKAVRDKLCWVCGEKLGVYKAFLLGPMCVVNRVTSEPPSHEECANYSVRACPFLTRPHAARRENALPANVRDAAGVMLKGNPGVTALWMAKEFKEFSPPGGGRLFNVGEPTLVAWFREGRAATRDEVHAAMLAGLPGLAQHATADDQVELTRMVERAVKYFPDA